MELIEKASKIKSLLSDYQKTQHIVELENNFSNIEIIKYLESIGSEKVNYAANSNFNPYYIREKCGVTYLWYKRIDRI